MGPGHRSVEVSVGEAIEVTKVGRRSGEQEEVLHGQRGGERHEASWMEHSARTHYSKRGGRGGAGHERRKES